MRQLMLGNKALARGLYEGGCSIVSSYPGTPSTEVTEEAVKFEEIYCEWAPNEKVALETAFGASLGTIRLCLLSNRMQDVGREFSCGIYPQCRLACRITPACRFRPA